MKLDNSIFNEKNRISKDEAQYVIDCYRSHDDDVKLICSDKDYAETNEKLLSFLNINRENHFISFASCATEIIEKLFQKYVDDDTLILTSYQEHPNVDNIIYQYSNQNVLNIVDNGKCSIELNELSDISMFLKRVKKYKRVFLYLIGTTCGDGVITSTSLINHIQMLVKSTGVELISVIDAVQELFLFSRDYSSFDYVIGTAHALVPEYDTGIVINKTEPFMQKLKSGERLVGLIKIILNRRSFFSDFSFKMKSRYRCLISKYNLECHCSTGHLFSIGDTNGLLKDLIPESEMRFKLTSGRNKIAYKVMIRACWLFFEDLLLKARNQHKNSHLTQSSIIHSLDNFQKHMCDIV